MRVIIDRFEGQYAVCETEDRQMVNIEKAKLPHDAKDGSVLIIGEDKIDIDIKETEERQNKIKILMEDLWKS